MDGLPPIWPRGGCSGRVVRGRPGPPAARHWACCPEPEGKRGGHRRAPTAKRPPSSFSGEAPTEGPPPPPARVTSAQVEAFTRPLRMDLRVRVKSLALKVRSSIPTACATRSRPDASYSTVGVGDQLSFRLIQDNQFVAKRVAYSRATADHYVEWGQNRLASRLQKGCESLVDVGDKMSVSGPIWRVCHQLGVRLRKTETRSFIAAPQQSMT